MASLTGLLDAQAGKVHTAHESPEVLAERGKRLLMASDPNVRKLYATEGDGAVSEDDLKLLLYQMARSLSNAETTPTEKLMQLGPQFYPNPLLELGLADLAIEVMTSQGGGGGEAGPAAGKAEDKAASAGNMRGSSSSVGEKLQQMSYRMPLLSSNSLLRVGLDHRGNLGPQDLMKRGYRVLEELSDGSKTTLKLENLTTLRPNSASLAATLRAISRGLPAYNLGTAPTLARIIDAGSPLATAVPVDTPPVARKLLWWGEASKPDPNHVTWEEREQLADLAYALIGLQTVPKQRGPQGDITTDELIGIGRARADQFTYMELVQMGQQSMGVISDGTRAALSNTAKALQQTESGLVTSLLARALADQQPGAPPVASTPLDRLVSQGLQKMMQGEQAQARQQASPHDLVQLGLLQLGLEAAKGMASAASSMSDLVNLGALHQQQLGAAEAAAGVAATDLIGLGSSLLDRVAADYGARAAEPGQVMEAVAAALEQGGGSLRLSSLDALELVQVGRAALNGDKLRMQHVNTAVEVMQDDPHAYRSHADGPIAFQYQ